MRATQRFIDEQFGGLFAKIAALNPELIELIREEDPEMQYKILRQIDRMDDKLFYVAIGAATEKWLDEMMFRIDWPEMFPATCTIYKVAGYTEEEVDNIYKNQTSPDKLHEEIVKNDHLSIDKIKRLLMKPMSKKTKHMIHYVLAITSACVFGVILGKVTE